MRKDDLQLAKAVSKRLNSFAAKKHPLPGIADKAARETFLFQIIESVRRIRFIKQVSERPIAESRKDPTSEYFDPIRAAILYIQSGNFDEAGWLVFLFVHFGRNLKSGYRLIADIYGKLGNGMWTWAEVSADPHPFRDWLDKHQQQLKTSGSVHRAFGNHRKYQSLHAWKRNGTGDAVESYVRWIIGEGGHRKLFSGALDAADGDPEEGFANLYRSMSAVISFGRTAKFDYLAMIGKIGIADIRPNSVHFGSATGPVFGAKLLFNGSITSKASVSNLETLSDALAVALQVDKQVIEDSLCNWQKSPSHPVSFRG